MRMRLSLSSVVVWICCICLWSAHNLTKKGQTIALIWSTGAEALEHFGHKVWVKYLLGSLIVLGHVFGSSFALALASRGCCVCNGSILILIFLAQSSVPSPRSSVLCPRTFRFGVFWFLVFVLDRVERRAPLLTAHNSEIMTCHLHCSLVLDFIVFDGPAAEEEAEEEGQAKKSTGLRSPVCRLQSPVSRWPGSVCGFGGCCCGCFCFCSCCYRCLSIQTKNNEKLFNKNNFEGKSRLEREVGCWSTEGKKDRKLWE